MLPAHLCINDVERSQPRKDRPTDSKRTPQAREAAIARRRARAAKYATTPNPRGSR